MNLEPKTLLDILIKMVLPVLAGYIATKAKILSDDYPSKLSNLILHVCQPFLLVSSVLGIEHSKENINAGLTILLCGFVSHAVAALLAFIITKPVKDKKTGRILEHCMLFGNCGFFGIPIVRAVFGPIGAFYAGFFIITFNLVLWSYGVFVLGRSGKETKTSVKKILFNAGTIPCMLGLILFFAKIPIYSPVLDGMRMIGDSCTPLSMIIVGAMIARIPALKLISSWGTYFVCAVKLIVIPVAIGAFLALIGFSDKFAIFGALMMSLPTASSSAMFAQQYDIEPELAAHTVGITTIVSVGTIPLIMQLVKLVVELI